MQPNETYSVPRRSLDVEDYIDIVRRHKGWIFGPFLLALVVSVVGVYLLPDSYVSQATVRIVPQSVPEALVASSINQAMIDRIVSMREQILSRSVLTNIINNFVLYPRDRNRIPVEDIVEAMRKKVFVEPVGSSAASAGRNVPAFVVRFSYEDRYQAQRVVQDLVTRFIDIHQKDRSQSTYSNEEFMKDELDQAQKTLDEADTKLSQFRIANNGRLPDQVDSNSRALMSLQAQSSSLDSAINRATADKIQIENQIQIAKNEIAALSKEPQETAGAAQKNERLAETEREIETYESNLALLRQKYRDNYPDVVLIQGRLAGAKAKKEELLKEDASKKSEPSAPRAPNPQTEREIRAQYARIQAWQSQVEAKNLEIEQDNKEIKRVSAGVTAYSARIDALPLGEKLYGDLIRERDIAKQHYLDMEQKRNRAALSSSMENRSQGEKLELLDAASLPISQTDPNRPLVISVGAGFGLVLGMVIAGVREMKDTSLKNLKDVRAYTQMAILGSIPLLENDFVVRRRRRLAWLGWTTACLGAAVIMSGSIVYYYVTKV